jgi:hypothetical protein
MCECEENVGVIEVRRIVGSSEIQFVRMRPLFGTESLETSVPKALNAFPSVPAEEAECADVSDRRGSGGVP